MILVKLILFIIYIYVLILTYNYRSKIESKIEKKKIQLLAKYLFK